MNCFACGALVTDGEPYESNWHRPFCVFWTKPFCLVEEKHCKQLWYKQTMMKMRTNEKCPGCGASLVQNSQNGQTVYTCINKDCKFYNPVFLEALPDKNSGKHQSFEYDPSEEKK